MQNNRINTTKNILNFGFLNKFRSGVIMTKSKPIKLLIKKRGYRKIFVQKLFIIKNYNF